jgi:hypothetical protein
MNRADVVTTRLTAKALSLALGDAPAEQQVEALYSIAAGNRVSVERALGRILRATAARPSEIGERAADTLTTVLHRVEDHDRLRSSA